MEISDILFVDNDTLDITPAKAEIKRRYEAGFAFSLDHPALGDAAIRDYLIRNFKITRSQAYRDIAEIKKYLGNVKNAGKEWHRHTVVEMLKRAYAMALKKKDYTAMITAAAQLGKYTKVDKEDAADIPWDKIIPPSWEPTGDISVLNIKNPPDNDKRKAALMKKYLSEDVVEIEFTE